MKFIEPKSHFIFTAAIMELGPTHIQLRNGKYSVNNLTTAFPLLASATHIEELCPTQQILLPQGLKATAWTQPPEN